MSAGCRISLGMALAAWWRSRFSTFHEDMLRTTRRAPRLLGSSTSLIRGFLLDRQNSDGGFRGRAPESDLYYTGFALDGLLALNRGTASETESVRNAMLSARAYLASFGLGDGLDLVHLCCLARGHAALRLARICPVFMAADRMSLARQIEKHRSSDGAYHPLPRQSRGSAYAAFLAVGAYQDLRCSIPQAARLAPALESLRTPDGLWANATPASASPGLNPTAAALAVLGQRGMLNTERGTNAAEWLMAQWHPMGGFLASPLTPIPDLLSTATALHTLTSLGVPISLIRRQCLDYLDSLWNSHGSFHAHWQEDELDVEYTFYGLLALGHLA